MNLLYRYSVDIFQANLISGWCHHRLYRRRPVTLYVIADGVEIAQITADIFREDLHEQKIHSTGNCGFQLIMPGAAKEAETIELFTDKGSRPLISLNKSRKGQIINEQEGFLSLVRKAISGRRPIPVLFMHIPKTAGTSFNSFARKIYTEKESISHIEAYLPSEYSKLQQRFRFISGHLNIGALRAGFDLNNVQLYTILRNPFKHLHSHISWLKEVGSDPGSEYYKKHNSTFQRLAIQLQKYDLSDTNELKKFIDNMEDAELLQFDNCQTRYFLSKSPTKIVSSDLDEAQENLRLFSHIGFTENYQEFEDHFAQLFKRSIPSKKNTHLNRSKKKVLFDIKDQEVRNTLYPLIEKDLRLYEAAQQLFGPQ